jgi:hypothetical protein
MQQVSWGVIIVSLIVSLSGCVGLQLDAPADIAQAQEQEQAPTSTPQPAPTPTLVLDAQPQAKRYPLDPEQQMGLLPDGILAYYSPDGQIYGILTEGEPYHVIGRRGNSWLYIRLPYVGQFWIVRAQLPKAEAAWAPEY